MRHDPDLIGRRYFPFDRNITIKLPTLGEIRADTQSEECFWREAGLFMKTPFDMLSELDDMGIDPEKISDYELFTMLLLFAQSAGLLRQEFFFDNFSLSELKFRGGSFYSPDGRLIIDENIYRALSDIICGIMCTEKTPKIKFGNKFAKQKRIELDRKKKLNEHRSSDSPLGRIILRLVCSPAFPYDFSSISGITVYELFCSVRQLDRDILLSEISALRCSGADVSRFDDLSRYALDDR